MVKTTGLKEIAQFGFTAMRPVIHMMRLEVPTVRATGKATAPIAALQGSTKCCRYLAGFAPNIKHITVVMQHAHDVGVAAQAQTRFRGKVWSILQPSLNLHAAFKKLGLGGTWVRKRMKAIRYALLNVAGRVIHYSRQVIVRLSAGGVYDLILAVRQRLPALVHIPAG